MKAHVSMAIMARSRTQSHAVETVANPMKSSTPDSTYRKHTRTNNTAGVRNALKMFLDWKNDKGKNHRQIMY
ncbi:hypothetical protein JZ751_006755 [Albula glossodonta]|uniref:Uncharacterized protein n=1 Tax=Albula glossodonta TaxID=121402 RepID=A0A8T2P1X3_9TELE|nr:hypothetical protein JZ751_006755 [Albula glossodonta]